jgi:diacylglycerol kinase (ATP)
VRLTVVANPAAGDGRGQRVIARLRPLLQARGVSDIRLTSGPGDEARLAQRALDDGAEGLIAVGGDGTWSRVAAVLGAARSPVPLALLAAGRGNDFAKTLGLPVHDHVATLALLQAGQVRPCDLGRVDGTLFLNVAGFGFDAHVLARTQGGGAWTYARVAAAELARYRALRVAVDDGPPQPLLLCAAANGAHFGGTFHIAPGAAVDDGVLQLVTVADLPPLARVPLLAAALRGRHIGHRATTQRATGACTLTFDAPPLYQADGELQQARDRRVLVEVVPGAIRLVAGL